MSNAVFKIGAIYFGNGNLILDNCSFTQNGENVVDLYCYPDATSNITLKRNIVFILKKIKIHVCSFLLRMRVFLT